jgi:prevent-host-death family protein
MGSVAHEIPVTQARADLADLVNRVAYSGDRVVLTRHGKPVAALVSAEDLELLEQLARRRVDLTGTGPAAGPRDGAGSPQHEPLRIAAEHRPHEPHRPGFRY